MSEQSEAIVTATPSSTAQCSSQSDGARQLAYAWVGLWGVAAEDFGVFYQRCVARGEQILNAKSAAARLPVKPQVAETAVSQPSRAASRRIRPLSIFNAFGAVESYHIDLNAAGLLPTQQELDALNERVEALAREVDALVKQREE